MLKKRVKVVAPIIPKKGFVNFIKTGFSKILDPWVWLGLVKGIFIGVIATYLYLEGWPF